MSTFLDASFAVSLYRPDKNSLKTGSQVHTAKRPLVVSSLCEFETANTFRLTIFRGNATLDEAKRSLRKFALHLEKGVLVRVDLPNGLYLRGERISSEYTTQLGTRGADILHVAAALDLGADSLFSFDLQQRKLAEATGHALNPI